MFYWRFLVFISILMTIQYQSANDETDLDRQIMIPRNIDRACLFNGITYLCGVTQTAMSARAALNVRYGVDINMFTTVIAGAMGGFFHGYNFANNRDENGSVCSLNNCSMVCASGSCSTLQSIKCPDCSNITGTLSQNIECVFNPYGCAGSLPAILICCIAGYATRRCSSNPESN